MYYKIKRFFWLCAVFIVRIVFSKNSYKTSRLKALYYNINGGFTINQVALYNLTKENKKNYLSEFDWYKSRKINHPYGYMLNDKVKCADMIEKYVNVPKLYIKKENNVIYDNKNKIINIENCIKIIKKNKSVFFKPIKEGKGNNVFRIDYKNNKFYKNFEEIKQQKLEEILKNKENYFISECINQAKYLNDIYDKTSNTIRLIVVNEDNKTKILYAVQRIGTKNTIPVDNGSKGGLIAKIDLKTGKLSKAKCMYSKEEFITHPDSKCEFESIKIPRWDELKEKMIEVTKNLSNFKFIAWDILVTDEGFYVIEANNSSGVNIIQVFDPQRNDVLGDFYRKHKVIK